VAIVWDRRADFGATFAATKLAAQHGCTVSDATRCGWMIVHELWQDRRRRLRSPHQLRWCPPLKHQRRAFPRSSQDRPRQPSAALELVAWVLIMQHRSLTRDLLGNLQTAALNSLP
jgi:hypothetical protein